MDIAQVTLSNNSNNSRREILDPESWRLRAANRRLVEEYEMLLFPSDGSKAQEILQTVNAFGWRSFVQCPGDYNRNIVVEFYSNLNPVSRTSTVRGIIIRFDAEFINDIFNLRNTDDSETKKFMDDRDVDFVRHVLGELCPNGVKVYSGTGERLLNINCSCMLELARAWGRFVSSRLIPYLNTSNYNIERVLLIYAIMHELPVNAGRLMSNAMVSCRIKSDCECLYFPSTITRLASLFDVDLSGLPKTENSYFIGSDFLHSLRPPTGPTQDEQEQMLVDSGNEAENEPEQPLNSEIGTTPTILVPDILVSMQELLQRQTELMNSWEIFRSEQAVREAVLSAHVEHIMKELREARNTHNLICQTLQNQFAYTSPIIYTIGTVMCNIANTMRSSDIPSFFPHFTVPGGGSLNVTGANFYQGTHVFVPTPLPTTMMDLNRGSGSTPSPMTLSSQPLSVFSNLEANHGVATTGGSSVPIQQDNGFDVNTYLDFFQGNGHEN